jgi:hypothetical protein
MRIKKETIILLLVIIALTLYLVLHKSNRTRYQLPVLSKVTEKDITRLEIQQSGKTIALSKKDNKWFIAPKDNLADATVIDRMLDVIGGLTLTALASESENYQRYDLEADKKITVKAWTGKTLSREFDIGKPVPTYQHTFVHLINDPNVYHADGNFRNTFDKTVENLRDKIVLSFEKNQVQNLSLSRGKTTAAFVLNAIPEKTDKDKNPAGNEKTKEQPKVKMEWQTVDGKKADEATIDGLLGVLERLKCDAYQDTKTKNDFQNPSYEIDLKGSLTATLSIFDKSDQTGDKYPAISSQNHYPFFLSEYQGKNIVEKIDKLITPPGDK